MTVSFRPSSLRNIVLSLAGAALACTLTGCGMGVADTTLPEVTPSAFSGAVHGGESPLIYSKVSFYETKATGVATASGVSAAGASTAGVYVPATALTPLGSTYTDINGNFTFGTALACTSTSDYVYAVAAGGNSGSYPGTLNANTLLMSALGSCNNLSAGTTIVINELTTIAAAYALSGFTSITGSYTSANGTILTSVAASGNGTTATFTVTNSFVSGQPVTLSNCVGFNSSYYVQSATAGSFTVAASNVGTATGCTVTPLTVTAVPIVSVTSSSTNYATGNTAGTSAAGLAHAFATATQLVGAAAGLPYAFTPNNQAGTTTPLTMINFIGNILQSCVNSTGGCSTLFTNTTAPVSGSPAAPSTTLAAVLNMAHYPYQNVANLCGLEPGTGAAFAPAISNSTCPNDLTLAIAYNKYAGGSTTTGLIYPYSLTLDGKDNAYVVNANASSTTQSNIVAFNNNSTTIYATTPDTTNVTLPRNIEADGLGNLYVTNDSSSTTGVAAGVYSAASGANESLISASLGYLFDVGIDTSNNAWFAYGNDSPTQNLTEYTCSSSGTGCAADTLGVTPAGAGYGYETVPDQYGNIWLANYNSSTAVVPYVLPVSTGYTTAVVTPTAVAVKSSYGIIVDSSGNGWYTSIGTINKLTATYSGANAVTGLTGTAAATYTASGGTASLRYVTIDGNNTLWSEDNNTTNSAVVGYTTTAATPVVSILKPCIANTGTACPAVTAAGIYGPRITKVDSSGNLWVLCSTNGSVVEIVGAGAPSWPLLAKAKYGLMP